MRPIDADALKESARRVSVFRTYDAGTPDLRELVDAAPTIDLAPQWISVKDRLPESEVLAANFAKGTYGFKEYIIGYVDVVKCTEPDWDRGKCYAENEHEILNDVTHWMPLPEPPKEES